MLSPGYLVTRGEMDSWCKKRPEYNLASTNANLCLSATQITSNYYSTCSASGRMPTFSDLGLIRYAVIPVTNNHTSNAQIRVGWKVSGGSTTWTSFRTLTPGSTSEYIIEGLPVNQTVYFYLDSDYSAQSFYVFLNNSFVSTVADGGYFTCTPITGSTSSYQKSLISFHVMFAKVKVSLTVYSDINVTARIYNASIDFTRNGTEMTFTNVPWNDTFSLRISGDAGGGNAFYIDYMTGSWADTYIVFSDRYDLEVELQTGATPTNNHFEIYIGIDQEVY